MADARKTLSIQVAKQIWIHAQRLNTPEPFGDSADATTRAIEHLGYVQIDTINVIERCHHHILFNRIPAYRREHLTHAQRDARSVFEYWTHALSYIPARDFRFFIRAMNEHRRAGSRWFGKVDPVDLRRVLKTLKSDGALTIRDMNDEVLVEKLHPWASRKPSKKALELAFYSGQAVVSERIGMLKKYDLTLLHFGWEKFPRAATVNEELNYRLDRALRSQGLVTLDSVAYLEPSAKPAFKKLVDVRVKAGSLIACDVEGVAMWGTPLALNESVIAPALTHLLSPFDPLVIQRKRLKQFFGYEHRFEAYVPAAKRVYGYFALPVLMEDQIVALIDLKTDRARQKLLIQKWSWLPKFKSAARRRAIEDELGRFELFQLQRDSGLG